MIRNILQRVWRIPELRKSIFFVFCMLVIFRLAAHIPIPGVHEENLRDFFANNQFLGLVNIFSGGGMENFSIVAMGVAPYITASIIFQLLTMIVPKLEELMKEGPSGQKKIQRYTRFAAIPLSFLQSFGLISILKQSSRPILGDLSSFDYFSIMLTLSAGTVFLMWLGEMISEKNIGNGISFLIFAGIIASLPTAVQNTILNFDNSQILNIVFFIALAVVTIVGVVFISEAQRNIPVSYARVMRGQALGGVHTYLPLRVNQAGVIPIIFAVSMILFPPMVAQFFLHARSSLLVKAAEWTISIFQDRWVYGILYFVLVFAFTFFYTAIVFRPDDIAENLQKQGGFMSGIRPGKATSEYLQFVSSRILLAGALFLSIIAILPLIVEGVTGLTTLAIGGTSMLIVISVVIEMVQKIDAQITMRDYDGV
ncbi:MAG: preprotein translocase subunit SecY [Parcubacteria group bacterium]|nr:preprotein translocase subunit SecY [Parcubacteria group bacterium]